MKETHLFSLSDLTRPVDSDRRLRLDDIPVIRLMLLETLNSWDTELEIYLTDPE
jgi:hypothetical protein